MSPLSRTFFSVLKKKKKSSLFYYFQGKKIAGPGLIAVTNFSVPASSHFLCSPFYYSTIIVRKTLTCQQVRRLRIVYCLFACCIL